MLSCVLCCVVVVLPCVMLSLSLSRSFLALSCLVLHCDLIFSSETHRGHFYKNFFFSLKKIDESSSTEPALQAKPETLDPFLVAKVALVLLLRVRVRVEVGIRVTPEENSER